MDAAYADACVEDGAFIPDAAGIVEDSIDAEVLVAEALDGFRKSPISPMTTIPMNANIPILDSLDIQRLLSFSLYYIYGRKGKGRAVSRISSSSS